MTSPGGPLADADPLPWLADLLEGWSEVEREDFIAALLLNAGFDPDALDASLAALMERFAIRADIEPGSPGAVENQVAAYFELHPLAEGLVRAFEARFRADLLAQDPEAFKTVLDQLGRSVPRFEPRAPPPEGAHRGGALGFFAAREQLDKED